MLIKASHTCSKDLPFHDMAQASTRTLDMYQRAVLVFLAESLQPVSLTRGAREAFLLDLTGPSAVGVYQARKFVIPREGSVLLFCQLGTIYTITEDRPGWLYAIDGMEKLEPHTGLDVMFGAHSKLAYLGTTGSHAPLTLNLLDQTWSAVSCSQTICREWWQIYVTSDAFQISLEWG